MAASTGSRSRVAAAAASGLVLLAVVVVQLPGRRGDLRAQADSLLAQAGSGQTRRAELKINFDAASSPEADLKKLGLGSSTQLFDSLPQDLDGLPAEKKTQILARARKAQQRRAAAAKASAAAKQAAAARLAAKKLRSEAPTPQELKLDREAKKEGESELHKDAVIAEKELKSPEGAVKNMLAEDKRAVAARESAFREHVQKMKAADVQQEKARQTKEAYKQRYLDGYVTSADARYDKDLEAAVKKETAGDNDYNKRYASEEKEVHARDESWRQMMAAEKAKEAAATRQAAQARELREAKEDAETAAALLKMKKASDAAEQTGEAEDKAAVAGISAGQKGRAAHAAQVRRDHAAHATRGGGDGNGLSLRDAEAHTKMNKAREADVSAITAGVSDGVDQSALEAKMKKAHMREERKEKMLAAQEKEEKAKEAAMLQLDAERSALSAKAHAEEATQDSRDVAAIISGLHDTDDRGQREIEHEIAKEHAAAALKTHELRTSDAEKMAQEVRAITAGVTQPARQAVKASHGAAGAAPLRAAGVPPARRVGGKKHVASVRRSVKAVHGTKKVPEKAPAAAVVKAAKSTAKAKASKEAKGTEGKGKES